MKNNRIRKVFKNSSDVIDAYIKQKQDYGVYRYTSGGSWMHGGQKGEKQDAMYFHADRMFSYGNHFLLAKMNLEMNGRNICVVNYSEYSNQTSCHARCVYNALQGKGYLIVDVKSDMNFETTDKEIKEIIIEKYKKEFDSLYQQLFESQFNGDTYVFQYIEIHNKEVKSLGLDEFSIKVESDIKKDAEKVRSFKSKVAEDIDSRKQLSLSGNTQRDNRSSYYKRQFFGVLR